jgi:hypothetical protein
MAAFVLDLPCEDESAGWWDYFSQRFTGTFSPDGGRIAGSWEI